MEFNFQSVRKVTTMQRGKKCCKILSNLLCLTYKLYVLDYIERKWHKFVCKMFASFLGRTGTLAPLRDQGKRFYKKKYEEQIYILQALKICHFWNPHAEF